MIDGFQLDRRLCKRCWHRESSDYGESHVNYRECPFPFIDLWEGGIVRFRHPICVLEIDLVKMEYPMEAEVPPKGCPYILEHMTR